MFIHRCPSSQVEPPLLSSSPQDRINYTCEVRMTMPSIRDQELDEDEWDPQGLNAMSFDVEASSEDDEEDEGVEDEVALEAVVELTSAEDDEEEVGDPTELDVDGLTELEQMEQRLLSEESLDFAMITEEE